MEQYIQNKEKDIQKKEKAYDDLNAKNTLLQDQHIKLVNSTKYNVEIYKKQQEELKNIQEKLQKENELVVKASEQLEHYKKNLEITYTTIFERQQEIDKIKIEIDNANKIKLNLEESIIVLQ